MSDLGLWLEASISGYAQPEKLKNYAKQEKAKNLFLIKVGL